MSDNLVPQSAIDRANEDIVGVIRGYLPDLKKTGKNWSARCPFHKEKSGSFTVSEHKEMFYCFGCGAGGDAVKFVMDHQGMSFRDAVQSILGELTLEAASPTPRKQIVRATRCDLPGHAEDRAVTAALIDRCDTAVMQHPYLLRNNTANNYWCLTLKGSLMVPMTNNIGEHVNMARITADGEISFAAGNPSFGSTAILEPEGQHDGKTIICVDYAHAWRIWWSQRGKSRLLACMDHGNFKWMLANCKERFTHVGCDQADAEEHLEFGRHLVILPLDPYEKVDMGRGQQ